MKRSLLLTSVFALVFNAQGSTWTGGNGSWNSTTAPGWTVGGVPNAQGAAADFTSAGANVTITQNVATGVTLGSLTYNGSSNNSWANTLTNSLTFNQDGSGPGFATISNTNTSTGTSNFLLVGNAGAGSIILADDLLISNTAPSANSTGAIQIAGVISGAGNITLSNTNNVVGVGVIRIVTAVNTFTGNVLVQKGITTFNKAEGFGNVASNVVTLGQSGQGSATLISTAAVTLPNNIVVASGSGGTLVLGSTSTTSPGFSGTLQLNGDVSITSLSAGTNNLTFSNVISGSGNLTKIGTGNLALSGANTFSGSTILAAGTGNLNLKNSLALQSSTLDIAGAVVFDTSVSSHAFSLGALTGSATIPLQDNTAIPNAVALSVGGNDTSPAPFSGALTGPGSLAKIGAGTLQLSGTNTYTGTTLVTSGKLLVNGSITATASTTVDVGGTLGGSGSISGLVTVSGVLSPGASVETLATGSIAFNAGSSYAYELDSSTSLAAGADLLKVTGNLDLSSVTTLSLSDIAASPVQFGIGTTTLSLINYTGAWNGGQFSFAGNPLADGAQFTAGLNTWEIDYDAVTGGSNFSGEHASSSKFVNITAVTPVPEPGSFLLGSVALLPLFRRRRSR